VLQCATEQNAAAAFARDAGDIGDRARDERHQQERVCPRKKPITKSEQVDYFFQRMFGVMRLLLKGTGRGG
jgi:hypothetical protein